VVSMELISAGGGLIAGVLKAAIDLRGQILTQNAAYQNALLQGLLQKIGAVDASANAALKRMERTPWLVPVVVCTSYFSILILPTLTAFFGIPTGIETEVEVPATAMHPAQVFTHWIVIWGVPLLRESLSVLIMSATFVLGAMPTKLVNRI